MVCGYLKIWCNHGSLTLHVREQVDWLQSLNNFFYQSVIIIYLLQV